MLRSRIGIFATTSDLDIYRSDKLLFDQHGESATLEAAMRADKSLTAGKFVLN